MQIGASNFASLSAQLLNARLPRFIGSLLFGLLLLTAHKVHAQEPEDSPLVFAAASLTDVLGELTDAWQVAGHQKPRLSFAASATMARQIQAGAPADLFISANEAWADTLEKAQLVQSSQIIASNGLVLVTTKGAYRGPFEATGEGFLKLIGAGRLAIADPALAPAGAYSKSFLEKAGAWEALKSKIAYGQNVRQVLRLAERGGLPAIIYASDATASDRVDILYQVPASMTPPILYKAVLLQGASDASGAFYTFIASSEAAPVWQKHGFSKIASN